MLDGVVPRGTAQRRRDLGVPVFGKTGTTTGPKDVWFIGGTADVVAGLYLGFDQPRNMGGYAQGGSLAAPIYKQFFLDAPADRKPVHLTSPKNIRMVRIAIRTAHPLPCSCLGSDPTPATIRPEHTR